MRSNLETPTAESLGLRPHRFERFSAFLPGGERRQTVACPQCGATLTDDWQLRQICLGATGELMLAHEPVPERWKHDFPTRVRAARRAWKWRRKPK